MSAEKITVTVDPQALELVLGAAQLASDRLVVQLAEDASGKDQFNFAVIINEAVRGLRADFDEARLAQ